VGIIHFDKKSVCKNAASKRNLIAFLKLFDRFIESTISTCVIQNSNENKIG
jgi:hypothetical protein